ncbi:MAG: bifunctional UDP-N-acetylglucosamine diphosphorylase/glucosamine-1-phosphate N-acetyltransferase GlmU [Alphaproteobacteria bacterium]
MTAGTFGAVILAAGKGTRMKSSRPKVMHAIAGRPMIQHLLETVRSLGPARVAVVIGPGMAEVADAVAPTPVAVQDPPLGTGHAVLAARGAFKGFTGDLLVLFAGDPLTGADTMRRLVEARRAADAAVAVLGMRVSGPNMYGRLVLGPDGVLERIVEFRDASPSERAIELCNAGVMALDGRVAFDLLGAIGNDNAKHEFYLTDCVAIARARGLACVAVEAEASYELQGVDSRAELARVEAIVQRGLRARAMDGGATLIDPDTVFFSHDTVLDADVIVEPNVVFGPGVHVAAGARVRAFSHLEGAEIGPGAVVGPFARLRPGTRIGAGARIGNFVEVKNAVFGEAAKANHLAYVGDAEVGARANIGAGTITANYDGVAIKARTTIGADVSIGSNSVLVAPVAVGDRAIIGAGSVITRDVAPDSLALTRAPQDERPGGAARFRAKRAKRKHGKGPAKASA